MTAPARKALVLYSAGLLAAAGLLLWGLAGATREAGGALVRAALLAFGLASLGALGLAFRSAGRALGQPLSPEAKVLGLGLVLPGLWASLEEPLPLGSALAVALAVWGFLLGRRGRDASAGAVQGVAATLAPGILAAGAWLLLRRRWRWSAVLAVVSGLGLLLRADLGGAGPIAPAGPGRSLAGLLAAAFAGVGLGPSAARLAALYSTGGVAGVLLAVLLSWSWRRRPGAGVSPGLGDVGAALCLGLLLLPGSGAGGQVLLWPGAMAGWDAWGRASPGGIRTLGAAAWWAAAALSLLLFPVASPWIPRGVPAGGPQALAALLLLLPAAHPGLYPAPRAPPSPRRRS